MSKRTENSAERFLDRYVRRAIDTQASLLAADLWRYAQAEDITWPDLAASLDCTIHALNTVALCHPPRPDTFVADVEAIAAGSVDVDRLLPLLRRLQVTAVLQMPEPHVRASGDRAEASYLLAAQDRDETLLAGSKPVEAQTERQPDTESTDTIESP